MVNEFKIELHPYIRQTGKILRPAEEKNLPDEKKLPNRVLDEKKAPGMCRRLLFRD